MNASESTTNPAAGTAEAADKIRAYIRRAIARKGPLWVLVNIEDLVCTSAMLVDDDSSALLDTAIAIVREEAGRVFEFLGQPVPELGQVTTR